MSTISNKLIERKLREVLELSASEDLSNFNDDTALTILFREYEDQIEFCEATQEIMLKEIEELKLAQIALRNELRYFKAKEDSRDSRSNDRMSDSRDFEANSNDERYKKLLNIAQEQQRVLENNKKSITQLEKKVYESTEANEALSREKETIEQQLESETQKEKEYKEEVESLKVEKEKIVLQYEQDIKKYKEEFLEELKATLQKKSDEENERNQEIIQRLKDELKNQETILKTVLHTLSENLKIKQPSTNDEINQWAEEFQQKFEAFRQEISRVSRKELKESKDPIKKLAEHQKKRMQARQFILENCLNSPN